VSKQRLNIKDIMVNAKVLSVFTTYKFAYHIKIYMDCFFCACFICGFQGPNDLSGNTIERLPTKFRINVTPVAIILAKKAENFADRRPFVIQRSNNPTEKTTIK
jgi:hypothetical protein